MTLVRCCSSSVDKEVDRCFEVNGFGGINFLKSPCEHLENVLGKLKKIRNAKKHKIPPKTERGMPDNENEITDEEVTKKMNAKVITEESQMKKKMLTDFEELTF